MAGAEATHANKDLMSIISDDVLSCTDTFVIGADCQSTPHGCGLGWRRIQHPLPCTAQHKGNYDRGDRARAGQTACALYRCRGGAQYASSDKEMEITTELSKQLRAGVEDHMSPSTATARKAATELYHEWDKTVSK